MCFKYTIGAGVKIKINEARGDYFFYPNVTLWGHFFCTCPYYKSTIKSIYMYKMHDNYFACTFLFLNYQSRLICKVQPKTKCLRLYMYRKHRESWCGVSNGLF